jgi:hypothetical protein
MALANNQNTLPGKFVVEWEPISRHSTISVIDNLQRELLQQHANRLIVIKGRLYEATTETLQSFCVDRDFLDAYQRGKVYRPRIQRDYAVKTFCWKFPQLLPSDSFKNGIFTADREELMLFNAALWVGIRTVILFIEVPVAVGRQTVRGVVAPIQPTHLEDELLKMLVAERQPVEIQVGQVVYERWRGLLDSEQMKHAMSYDAYWYMTVAMERNLEQARRMTERATALRYADEEDWKDILLGLERRVGIASLALLRK